MAEIVLKTKGTFYKYIHYTHVSFIFPVEKIYRSIVVDFSYAPLFLEEQNPDFAGMMREALATQIYRNDEPYVSNVIQKAIPIKNQISIAIKGPDGWRGEHHFFPGEQRIKLGKDCTTDKFIGKQNTIGMYELILHIFAVYTDSCDYVLTVTGEN